MKKLLCPISVATVLLLAATSPAFGFEKKKKATPAPHAHEAVISDVNPTAITITGDKGAKTFTITQFTEIIVNGRKATVAELKPGMTVNVALGTDPAKASRITAADKK